MDRVDAPFLQDLEGDFWIRLSDGSYGLMSRSPLAPARFMADKIDYLYGIYRTIDAIDPQEFKEYNREW